MDEEYQQNIAKSRSCRYKKLKCQDETTQTQRKRKTWSDERLQAQYREVRRRRNKRRKEAKRLRKLLAASGTAYNSPHNSTGTASSQNSESLQNQKINMTEWQYSGSSITQQQNLSENSGRNVTKQKNLFEQFGSNIIQQQNLSEHFGSNVTQQQIKPF